VSGDIPAYGGFREVRGYGLGRLGTLETGVVAVVVGGLAFSTAISLWAALYGLVIAVPVVAISVVPIGASRRTVAAHTAWWMRAWSGRRSGTDAWVADVFEEVPRGENLPGVLAPLVPLDVEDGRGGTQCLIWNRRTGVLSAILMVSPTGMTLSDQGDANSWVAAYGDWLADLGFSPIINSVAFTTESSPSGGVDQRSYVLGRITPTAPRVARQIMESVAAQTRSTTADVVCRVTINFDLAHAAPVPKSLAEGCTEVVRWMPRCESALEAAGITVTGRASTAQVIRLLRRAFDPAITAWSGHDDMAVEDLSWRDAGPIRTEPNFDVYRHDSGFSVTWAFAEPPAGVVRQHILLPLVTPGRYIRRFSLVYRPYRAGEAGRIVEREIQAGTLRRAWNQKTKKDETQREYDDRVRARRAAQEESLGAGLGRFTMYVTTTTRNESTLAAACADVEQRYGAAKLRFRRARGAQASAFAAGLGVGIEPTSGLSKRAAERWLG
jgi:hypothetical protein